LLPAELSADQRSALQRRAEITYVAHSDIAREALDLQGAFLKLQETRGPADEVGHELQTCLPTNDGSSYRSPYSTPVEYLRITPVEGGRTLRPPSPGLGIPRRYSDVSPPPAADLQADERLNAALSGRPPNVAEAVKLLADGGKLAVVASTRLADRRLSLPPAGAGEAPTLRQWMVQITRETGGYWARVGRAYALAPQPRVERAAAIEDWLRPRHVVWALDELARSLSASQRRKLRERRLAAADLTKRQADTLRWVAALGFVIDPEVAPDALALKGVTLALAKPAQAGEPPAVQCRLPTRAGAERLAASVPLP